MLAKNYIFCFNVFNMKIIPINVISNRSLNSPLVFNGEPKPNIRLKNKDSNKKTEQTKKMKNVIVGIAIVFASCFGGAYLLNKHKLTNNIKVLSGKLGEKTGDTIKKAINGYTMKGKVVLTNELLKDSNIKAEEIDSKIFQLALDKNISTSSCYSWWEFLGDSLGGIFLFDLF